jgi:hypothetical protein
VNARLAGMSVVLMMADAPIRVTDIVSKGASLRPEHLQRSACAEAGTARSPRPRAGQAPCSRDGRSAVAGVAHEDGLGAWLLEMTYDPAPEWSL